MAEPEPSSKRFKSNLPMCKSKCHGASLGSRVKQNLPAAVEETLCAVATLFMQEEYRLEALASAFEQDDIALQRVAAFFRQQSVEEQTQAAAMLHYLAERGGQYCNKDIPRPGGETARCGAVLPALELTLGQWKEEMAVLEEASRLARDHGDPHTASVVKSRFLAPLVSRVKLAGDLVTNARRAGCAADRSSSLGGFGEYLVNELQEELTGV